MKEERSPHDELTTEFAKKIRHTISESLAFVESSVRNLTGNAPDPAQALKLYNIGAERLKSVMKALDHFSASGNLPDSQVNEQKYDLILIDDDPLIKMLWEYEAKNRKLFVLVLSDPSEIYRLNISKKTPIYVDKNLISGLSGMEFLMELNTKGYELLYLASGESTSMEGLPSWVAGSTGKCFPESICG